MNGHRRLTAIFLLVLFASFICGNTCFVHSHKLLDGHIEVHSHPYIPGTAHSHSAAAFQSIAQMNAVLTTMMNAGIIRVPAPTVRRKRFRMALFRFSRFVFTALWSGRAPPAAA